MRGVTLPCAKPPPRRPHLQAFRCSVILQHARRNGPVREGAAAAAAPAGFFVRGNIATCAAERSCAPSRRRGGHSCRLFVGR
jgi:hypothetical protein